MSELGQSRHFDRGLVTSGLPRSTDIIRRAGQVRKVPRTDICATIRSFRALATCRLPNLTALGA